eukprot:superscaffoldBa00001049_g8684
MDAADSLLPDCINPNNFPAKLWRLVNNPANRAICWDSSGDVIIIDQQLFEKQILSPGSITSDNADAFKTTNFSSFVRQLNLYGFRKADPANTAPTNVITGTHHHFFNPNFKRNHPELLVNLRRLTVDNKAKLQAGLNVNCRPPSRYQRLSGGDDGRDKNIKRNKGIAVPLSHHYTGVASSPNALHIQQGLLARANHGNHNFTSFNVHNAQYQPGYFSPGCQCYHPNLVASHMKASGLQTGQSPFHSYYQAGYPVNNLCHGDQNQDLQYKENLEMKKCDVNLDTIFQIADEVMQTPNNCLVRVVTPEKPGTVSFNTSNTTLQASPQNDSPGSTRKANPLCPGPIIMAVSGNINLVTCEQQEGSVVSVPEQMPEDVILEVLFGRSFALFQNHLNLRRHVKAADSEQVEPVNEIPGERERVRECFYSALADEFDKRFIFPRCSQEDLHHVRPGTAAAAEAMTVPQRRLAGLWPWLLMAALQVVLGQPGLESERPALRAVIMVTLLKQEPTRKPITLEGVFVGGSAGNAEGKLMQVILPFNNFIEVDVLLFYYLNKWTVSRKVLTASSSTVRGHYYLHVPPAGPQHSRLGTRDGRAEGALRENIKARPVPNVSWDD